MTILQSGIAKSGNYWLHTIITQLLKKAGKPIKSFIKQQPIYNVAKNWQLSQNNQVDIDIINIYPNIIKYSISNIYQMPIDDLDKYLVHSTLVWTHIPFYEDCVPIYNKFDKIIYIIRDPRSVVLSHDRFQQTEYFQKYRRTHYKHYGRYLEQRLEISITGWCIKNLAYLKVKNYIGAYTVFYENMKQWPEQEISKLAHYLGIDVTNRHLKEIVILRILDILFFEMLGASNNP